MDQGRRGNCYTTENQLASKTFLVQQQSLPIATSLRHMGKSFAETQTNSATAYAPRPPLTKKRRFFHFISLSNALFHFSTGRIVQPIRGIGQNLTESRAV